LNSYIKIHTDGLAYIQHSSGLPGSEYVSRGDIVLHQNKPMRVGDKVSEVYPVQQIMDDIRASSVSSTESDISNIMRRRFAASRNIMVDYTERFSSWKRCISCHGNVTMPSRTFILSVTLDVPLLQQVIYVPTLHQVLLEIWIRYLALLTIAIFLMRRILCFIFSNQLLSSHVTVDKIS
jgi:Carbohydrate (N-acetylglucosamine 6-O) sulfotransferase 5.